MRASPMFASLEVCTTSRSPLADLLARMYFWTRPSLSRSLVGRQPCWTAACFLPCTRPPDITRLRLCRPTRRPGPSERDARHAFTLTRPVRARLGARDRRHLPAFVITRAGTATGGLHPLCSKLSRHLLPRAADLEGTSSFCFFLCFLVMLSVLW